MGLIYMRTSPEHKSYIGLTIRPEKSRWQQHCQDAFNFKKSSYHTKLSEAIRRFGKDNFTLTILDECPNDKLSEREIYWINYYDTYQHGYNETLGGEGYWKYNTEDMIELWDQGLNKKEIAKVIGCDEKTVRNHLNLIFSKEESYIRGQKRKRISDLQIQEIMRLWNEGYSIKEIQPLVSISTPTISKHLKINGITSEEIKRRSNEKVAKKNQKPIILYDDNNNIIEEYESMTQACQKLNLDIQVLRSILSGTCKKHRDLILKFKETV